jgi:cellobiose-specific phosphotransferase system component IIC
MCWKENFKQVRSLKTAYLMNRTKQNTVTVKMSAKPVRVCCAKQRKVVWMREATLFAIPLFLITMFNILHAHLPRRWPHSVAWK